MNDTVTTPIGRSLIDEVLQDARNSPRLRAIRRLHAGDWEHCHRMLNALMPGTYVQPHRHPDRHQGEGFILLRGRLALIIFNDDGSPDPDRSCILSPENGVFGIDIPSGVWHSLVALEESVIYEVKGQPAGGYVQSEDKEFAWWAPAEGDSGADQYRKMLEEEIQSIKV